jgi:hypothetical protein
MDPWVIVEDLLTLQQVLPHFAEESPIIEIFSMIKAAAIGECLWPKNGRTIEIKIRKEQDSEKFP